VLSYRMYIGYVVVLFNTYTLSFLGTWFCESEWVVRLGVGCATRSGLCDSEWVVRLGVRCELVPRLVGVSLVIIPTWLFVMMTVMLLIPTK
jgi:hypothetical protein